MKFSDAAFLLANSGGLQAPAWEGLAVKSAIEERCGKSKGHVAFLWEGSSSPKELIHGADDCLYIAPAYAPLDIYGYRQGARFECQPRKDGHKEYIKVVFGVEV